MDILTKYGLIVLAVVGGASAICKAIAPLTSTKLDDQVSTWLDKVYAILSKIALNP